MALPDSLSTVRNSAMSQNEARIPTAEAKNWNLTCFFAIPCANTTLLSFMPSTGKTHGMIFRMNPPNSAKSNILRRDVLSEAMAPATTVVGCSATNSSSLTLIEIASPTRFGVSIQLLTSKVATSLFCSIWMLGREKLASCISID